ncbi:hypothetical protein M422DRAFT_272556 [Sphaerobolus stellatus SS14]|uniref:Uncharacterized protein n=1 Tax=Sphaerobolus stellatus (strain SS14) TaxID=990650 RepID=A0A0C9ULV6_SPHS4|nr:hypothetical protein M422DRAFT_272556 [Sphaerobolus stellatus SS14]
MTVALANSRDQEQTQIRAAFMEWLNPGHWDLAYYEADVKEWEDKTAMILLADEAFRQFRGSKAGDLETHYCATATEGNVLPTFQDIP